MAESKMQYRPEIDGLRCVAVLAVVFFHAGFPIFPGGFLGVDVFFVISGFLITRIILREVEAGKFSLRAFYKRRIRRILPAVVFVMICCIPVAWALMVPFQFHEFSRSTLATLFFVSNVFFWRNSGYFDVYSEQKPLLHTWSLAVEEQFYIFFPLLIIFAWPFGRKRALLLIIALSIISLFLAEFTPRRFATASFFLLPTRAWEIGAGCILAFFPDVASRVPRYSREIVSILGFAAVGMSFLKFHQDMQLPGFPTLLTVLGTVSIIACAKNDAYVARFLSFKWVVAIGKISFSLYLWHQPVFSFSRLYFGSIDGVIFSSALVLICIFLSIFTYLFIEEPFRGRSTAVLGFPAVSKIVLASYIVLVTHWMFAFFEERNGRFLFIPYEDHPALIDARVEITRRSEWLERTQGFFEYRNTSEFSGARVLVMGDSHSLDVYNIFQSQKDSLGIVPARLPLFDGCMAAKDQVMAEQVTRDCISHYLDVEARDLVEPATYVVIALLWTKFAEQPELMDTVVSAAIDEIQKRGLIAVVSPGSYQSEPMLPFRVWKLFREGNLNWKSAGAVAFDVMREDVIMLNRRLEVVARSAGAEIFDRFEIMCSVRLEFCHALTPSGYSVYADDNHTTLEGASFLGELAFARGSFDIFLDN